ncbi:response regulator [Pseudomonas sp. MDMC216]|jgi:CheY-like chemotaxis protein|uniref:Response regulator receiver domain-containing protein n=1 Tax=Ectopseudomonas chengduensis TaxID=489632 RepID=A0A1G6IPW5_9GAMM|nr:MULTISPECIES: response regulator [Pseudomonas]KJU75610.1 chemotaxis protein CheY [Pseudomonas oleovorans]ERH52610.1 chemotaxis protein CheY [Pseudomonas chengduensis]KQO33511.1 two-component system response regulator [Pseudomonas sp. Leaf83]MBG0845067.1 response regulator [Pseudomonas chengduensis]MBP3059923.1 response regulator [Pseudomonas chengduensis]
MSKVSVLVVDDATFIRDLVKKGLRDNFPGVQIEEAINGRKAQQMLSRQVVDLILCDWEMPEMSGLELLTWCREQDNLKTTPFIMVTSRGDKENVVQAIQAGVSDYIGKPFSNEQLVTKVKKALQRAGKLQALMSSAPSKMLSTGGFANDSLAALTGGKAEVVKTSAPTPAAAAPAAPSVAPAPAAASKSPAGRGQGQLRLPAGSMACVIKALSLKEALLVVKRTEQLPQVLESAVLDLEQGEAAETARLNGYLHAVAAFEPKPDSEWLQLTFRFVDRDPQKLDYLSRLIARGTAQKHFSPGA